MTATTWLAIAGAVVSAWLPASRDARLGALAARGRLPSLATHRRTAAYPMQRSRVFGIATIAAAVGVCMTAGLVLGVAVAAAGWTAARLARDLARRRAAADAQDQLVGAVRVLVGELEVGSRPAASTPGGRGHRSSLRRNLARRGHRCGRVRRRVGCAVPRAGYPSARSRLAARCRQRRRARRSAGPGGRRVGRRARAKTRSRARPGRAAQLGGRPGLPTLARHRARCVARRAAVGLPARLGRGSCVAGIGVLLDLAGLAWMRAILRRAEGPW